MSSNNRKQESLIDRVECGFILEVGYRIHIRQTRCRIRAKLVADSTD